ncbi:MAG: hypothetical protein BRD50_05920 [Bacteroidetes bacterium SW_11_45_7]|nr:MAG: hypothetical protein BRD50_05920 [Bacteroidetes bacterium SW_11_45_7]
MLLFPITTLPVGYSFINTSLAIRAFGPPLNQNAIYSMGRWISIFPGKFELALQNAALIFSSSFG